MDIKTFPVLHVCHFFFCHFDRICFLYVGLISNTFYTPTAYLMAVIAGVSIGLLFNILSLGTLLMWILEVAPQKATKAITWLTYFFTTFAGIEIKYPIEFFHNTQN